MKSSAWRHLDDAALPVAPGLLADAVLLAGDRDPSAKRLMGLIRHEQVLTGRVLRAANSAAVGPLREVTTVEDAVIRLGTQTVRRLVVSLCMASWTVPDGQHSAGAHDFMRHAIGTACMARAAAGLAGVDAEEAFVAGLLHDIGKLLLVRLRGEFARRIGPPPSDDEFAAVVRDDHADAGDALLQLWGIPARLRHDVRWHHAPLDAPDPHRASVAWLANALSHRYGFGCPAAPTGDLPQHPVALALGVDEPWLMQLDASAASAMDDALAAIAA